MILITYKKKIIVMYKNDYRNKLCKLLSISPLQNIFKIIINLISVTANYMHACAHTYQN